MTYQWNYVPAPPGEEAEGRRLAEELGMHPVFGRMLRERCIYTAAAARRFFRPQLTDLHDPFLMNDMQVAVERLNLAIARKERIMVYGDYDVDGVTSVALVYRFISRYYSNIDYYIPDRYEEGYGVSKRGIDYAAETGVRLIIVLDCGIKAVEEITYAKECGIDFIICDHHVPDEVLPPAVAILNPKRRDNHYPYTHLSGCGVGFKFMQAFAADNGIEFNRLHELLDLCAVSIASDIVPVTGENRILAYHGLRRLNSNPSIGLQAIVEVCGLADRELTMNDIIFRIGPRINASGRMQNGKEAVQLLVENDYSTALNQASHINLYNEARKDLDRKMTEQATEQVSAMKGLEERRGIVIYNEEWHKGIIGIVASRVTEQYYRPAVVLTDRATWPPVLRAPSPASTSTKRCKAAPTCSKTSADTPMPPDSRCEWRTCRNFRAVSKPTWPNTFSTNRHNPRSTSPLCSTSTRSISNSTSSCANLPPSGPATNVPSSARPASMTMAPRRWWDSGRSTFASNWSTTNRTP